MKTNKNFCKIPLLQATLEDLWKAGIELGVIGICLKESPINDWSVDSELKGIPILITGVKALSAAIGVSTSTINRMLAEGVIDSATYQYGKILVFNLHAVLNILRRDKKK